jgi:hypothetical protein
MSANGVRECLSEPRKILIKMLEQSVNSSEYKTPFSLNLSAPPGVRDDDTCCVCVRSSDWAGLAAMQQADALICLLDSSLSNPVIAMVPLFQQEGRMMLNRWGIKTHIMQFLCPCLRLDEPYFLMLTSTAHICLTNDHLALVPLDMSIQATRTPELGK